MNFLNSFFWVFVPLVMLPLIIHWFNRSFLKTVDFPHIALIRRVIAGRRKLLRWRDIFFLLVRMLILALLLLVFLRPVFMPYGKREEEKERRVVVVVDHSLSMAYRGDSLSPLGRALSECVKILKSLGANDMANVILLEDEARACFPELSSDIPEMVKFIEGAESSFGSGDVNQVFQQIGRYKESPGEVFIVSDFQRSQWGAMDLSQLGDNVSVYFVNVGAKRPYNRAINGVELVNGPLMVGKSARLRFQLLNDHPQVLDTSVTCYREDKILSRESVRVESGSSVEAFLELPPLGPGVHRLRLEIDGDDLEADNVYHFLFEMSEREEVAFMSDDPVSLPSFYLLKAINPFEGHEGALTAKRYKSSQWKELAFSGISKSVITQMRELSHDSLKFFHRYLEKGGKALVLLDGEDDMNNLMHLVNQFGVEPPFRIGANITAENLVGGAQKFSWGKFTSPYLNLFRAESRHLLSQVEVYRYRQLNVTDEVEVLLKYRDGVPALIQWDISQATVIFANFQVDELYSNLARQSLFPAWIQTLIANLGRDEAAMLAHEVGNKWERGIWKDDAVGLRLFDPKGQDVPISLHWSDDKANVTFKPTLPGFYRLSSPRETRIIAVNPPDRESDLQALSTQVLENRIAANHDTHWVQGMNDYEKIAGGMPLMAICLMLMTFWVFVESLGLILWRRAA